MMMELLTRTLLYATLAVFCTGVLITAISGSARAVKLLLAGVTALLVLALAGGLIFTRGLLIYLTFQIIALVVMWYLVLIAGAVCGGGIYLLLHRKPPGKALTQAELSDYLTLTEFCAREGVDAERAEARIRSGYYTGGRVDGVWYIRRSELSNGS